MHNLIILGSGRSGTSLAAGLFHKSGYFMGDDLYAPNPANPKGFFENEEINLLNERLLSQVLPLRPKGRLGRWFFRKRPGPGQMWLSRLPLGVVLPCPEDAKKRIEVLVARKPFCFKDPRFSYTLPCWRPFLKDSRFLVIFRHPADTAKSIAKECNDASYLHSLTISRQDIMETWRLMYAHILAMPRAEGEWLFLHYDQLLDPRGLERMEAFAGAAVDRAFPERSLKRSVSNEPVPAEVMRLYRELCEQAGYQALP